VLQDGIFSNQKNWLKFGRSEDVGIFLSFCLFYGKMVYSKAVWYILWLFGIFFPVLECCIKKNLATLVGRMKKYYFDSNKFYQNIC
jgi:hypothetical protein